MGVYTPDPCIKGPACQALDAISSDKAAMTQLQAALTGISANFSGIENVLAQYLLPAAYSAAATDKIKAHLKACWFDPTSPTTYFPGLDVAKPYGLGILKVLELALERGVPIDSWWLPNHAEIDMLNFASPRQVTLVIATPSPANQALMQAVAQPMPSTIGFSTRLVAGEVQTRLLKIINR
jgi:hypothetical protein